MSQTLGVNQRAFRQLLGYYGLREEQVLGKSGVLTCYQAYVSSCYEPCPKTHLGPRWYIVNSTTNPMLLCTAMGASKRHKRTLPTLILTACAASRAPTRLTAIQRAHSFGGLIHLRGSHQAMVAAMRAEGGVELYRASGERNDWVIGVQCGSCVRAMRRVWLGERGGYSCLFYPTGDEYHESIRQVGAGLIELMLLVVRMAREPLFWIRRVMDCVSCLGSLVCGFGYEGRCLSL